MLSSLALLERLSSLINATRNAPVDSPLASVIASALSPISKRPVALLAKIFSYLPLKDRHQLCLVSSKWAAASRIPWTDVKILNISSIPRAMADPILGLCPCVQQILAMDQSIILQNDAVRPRRAWKSVRVMKLRNVSFERSEASTVSDVDTSVDRYLERFPNLAEITWQNVSVSCAAGFMALDQNKTYAFLPATASKMLLRSAAFDGLATTSLPIDFVLLPHQSRNHFEYLFAEIYRFQCYSWNEYAKLREVCIFDLGSSVLDKIATSVAGGNLPNLQVLIYASPSNLDPRSVEKLITAELALRLLVIAGKDEFAAMRYEMQLASGGIVPPGSDTSPLTLPARPYRRGFPQLHIFVGGDIVKCLKFTIPLSKTAIVHTIDSPMPQFLAKPDVAPIFKDVWAAKVIREGPQNGLLPWGSPDQTGLFYSAPPNE